DFALAEPAFKLGIAGLDVMRRIARHHNHEVAFRGSGELMNSADRFRKALAQALEIVNELRTLLLVEERMVFFALLAAQLADLRKAQGNDRKSRVDLQCSKSRFGKC